MGAWVPPDLSPTAAAPTYVLGAKGKLSNLSFPLPPHLTFAIPKARAPEIPEDIREKFKELVRCLRFPDDSVMFHESAGKKL